MGIDVDGEKGILAEDALVAPVEEVGGGTGIYIVYGIVGFFTATEDDAHEVMRADRVVVILQGGSDLVVRLGDDLGRGDLAGIVAKRTKGMNVSHGNV